MHFLIESACGSKTGSNKNHNEDNIYFDSRILEMYNNGISHCATAVKSSKNMVCAAVFDGMGENNTGEHASYTAASCLQKRMQLFSEYIVSEREFLNRLCIEINETVSQKGKELMLNQIGTTAAIMLFSQEFVYACNVGDSRIYRLRDGVLLQISIDRMEDSFINIQNCDKKLFPQYLGSCEDAIHIDPYVAKGKVQKRDRYLICSDGLTDMLTDAEIRNILYTQEDTSACADSLIRAAIENGGEDNITAIVCTVV